ncbi:patatin-like phospholipase family protein [Marinobacterium rhizophilum]|uniref:Patatin-like phospholipase family protein n=1 Tax=Marinobacterium rhizophilum TaxID=420402 RepID=A0ABY5HFV4_9GAMM|nr:patatin-like phospholipase family protein [Marinobacterium rhizophilum]UTW11123.1 patatin-like phospholipase family protein [Marinobacterium rhizophilum]
MGVRKINLALQGGGAHGAFTWGVLDRLLEEPTLRFEGVSGTSAGAMNAVMLASGLQQGGHEGARELLARFWHEVSLHALPELPKGLPTAGFGESVTDWMQMLSYYLSPYDLNPLDINPLRSLVERTVDFERLRAASPLRLFVAATDVQSGKLRLFRDTEMTADHLLASACLPTLHKAIEIDGSSYWDGGFSGNPAIYPLVFDCASDDVLVVLLQPLMRVGTPVSASSIRERVAEFGFQSTYLREMRALSYMQFEIRKTPFSLGAFERRVRRLRLHLIETDELLAGLDRASKYDTRLHFLQALHDRGRERAHLWLAQQGHCLGRTSSCDLGLFL